MGKLLPLFLASLLIGGCQTTNRDTGAGAITLSERTMVAFEYYLSHERPTDFAVSADGTAYGYSVCNDFSCQDSYGDVALSECRRRSKGQACRLFATGRDVVWKGPVSYRSGWLLDTSASARPFLLFWAEPTASYGTRPVVLGRAEYTRVLGLLALTVDAAYVRRFGACEGELAVELGQFAVSCAKTGLAKGSYKVSEKIADRGGYGGTGNARDDVGRFVELALVPASTYRNKFLMVRE